MSSAANSETPPPERASACAAVAREKAVLRSRGISLEERRERAHRFNERLQALIQSGRIAK